MKKRIYLVTDQEEGDQHLVKAPTRAAARATVTLARFKVAVATQDEIVELVSGGVKVIESVPETADDDAGD